jgi:hypothetical protein
MQIRPLTLGTAYRPTSGELGPDHREVLAVVVLLLKLVKMSTYGLLDEASKSRLVTALRSEPEDGVSGLLDKLRWNLEGLSLLERC